MKIHAISKKLLNEISKIGDKDNESDFDDKNYLTPESINPNVKGYSGCCFRRAYETIHPDNFWISNSFDNGIKILEK